MKYIDALIFATNQIEFALESSENDDWNIEAKDALETLNKKIIKLKSNK